MMSVPPRLPGSPPLPNPQEPGPPEKSTDCENDIPLRIEPAAAVAQRNFAIDSVLLAASPTSRHYQ